MPQSERMGEAAGSGCRITIRQRGVPRRDKPFEMINIDVTGIDREHVAAAPRRQVNIGGEQRAQS
jgi:hypothetical protein